MLPICWCRLATQERAMYLNELPLLRSQITWQGLVIAIAKNHWIYTGFDHFEEKL